MSVVAKSEDARILLEESDYRLNWARKYEPDTDPRVLCELAHDVTELALNSVIVAAGGRYRSTHDLGHPEQGSGQRERTAAGGTRQRPGTAAVHRRRTLPSDGIE